MGIKSTLKELRTLARNGQENWENTHARIYRIEREIGPPPLASIMQGSGGTVSSRSARPTLYTMVKDTYERAQNGYGPDGVKLTEGMAKMRADVATILNRQERVADTVGTTLKQIRGDLSGVYVNQESQSRQIDALQNQLAELRAEHHAAATAGEPVKVYASKGTTEMLQEVVERSNGMSINVMSIDGQIQELKDGFGAHRSFMVGQLAKIIEATEDMATAPQVKAIEERLGAMEATHRERQTSIIKQYQELYSAWYGSLVDFTTAPETKAIRERVEGIHAGNEQIITALAELSAQLAQLADYVRNLDDRLVQANIIDGGLREG